MNDIGETKNWEAMMKPKLLSLEPYRHLFPKPRMLDETVKRSANVSDTVSFIQKVVKQCSWQVEEYVNKELKGLSLYEACKKLWHFVRYHIEWVADPYGIESIQSPSRLIASGKGDCDCGTTFIDCCLHAYGAKNITNRITAYEGRENFQHIYPVVPDGKGGEIIIDFCVHKFNYQKPYTKKEDYNMELQFLDGIGETTRPSLSNDTNLFGGLNLGELGKLRKRKGGGGAATPPAEKKTAKKQKRKAFGKKLLKVVNKVNKINPATVLLRAGILASMKLNVMKIAEKIKWGYATPELAQSKGMDMGKYGKIKEILAKTEKIFFAAGGNEKNLRKAILTGHGNRSHEVAGIQGLSEDMSLPQMLGDIYHDEFVNGMEGFSGFEAFEGFGQLGEPATATALAAASTAMGTLAALLKSIGNLFPKKGNKQEASTEPGAEPSSETTEPTSEPSAEPNAESTAEENLPATSEPSTETEPAATSEEVVPAEENIEVTPSEEVPNEEPKEEPVEGLSGLLGVPLAAISQVIEKNKGWLIPLGIIIGVATLGVGVYNYTNTDPQPQPKPKTEPSDLGGTKKKRGRRKKKDMNLDGTDDAVIELM